MLDPRQLSRVLSVGFDFVNEWVCNRDGCSSLGSAPFASPKSSASAGIAGMLIPFWPLDCCSPACPLPFGKPGRDLDESADCWPGKQRDLLVFPSLVLLLAEGEGFGDFKLSHKFGMELCGLGCSQGHPSAGVDESPRLETGI